jgi:lysophospholipase L1-like esterase
MLRTEGIGMADPAIIATTGWTTAELIAGIDRAGPQGPFDLVSLAVGVNDQFRGRSAEGYREEFAAVLDRAVALAGGEPSRVLVLSLADWGVTPFAFGRDPRQIRSQIGQFNAIAKVESARVGAAFVDITPTSRLAALDPSLLSADGLHPSAIMYQQWAQLAFFPALRALGQR